MGLLLTFHERMSAMIAFEMEIEYSMQKYYEHGFC